jgi:hypothetical protein
MPPRAPPEVSRCTAAAARFDDQSRHEIRVTPILVEHGENVVQRDLDASLRASAQLLTGGVGDPTRMQ